MGGKNPVVILEDADMDLTVESTAQGAFGSSGQRCTATSRLILHESIYDQFMAMLVDRVEQLRIGDPLDPSTDVGPVVDEAAGRSIMNYIEIGEQEAQLVTGGYRLTGGLYDNGFFIAPTIFATEHGTRISKEEIFGPVLSVIKVRDFEEAVSVANDVDYGLSSSIYTRDVNLAFRAVEELETGITYINAPTIGAEVHLPFGGTKNTGNGGREAGTSAIDESHRDQTVRGLQQSAAKAQIDVIRQ
jgi:aldehyde dehydrogenase (NAD+)